MDFSELDSISGQDSEFITADNNADSNGGLVFKVYAFDDVTSGWVWTTSSRIMPFHTASEEKTIKRNYFLNDGVWCWDEAPKIQKQEQIDPIEVYSLDEATNEWIHTSTMVYSQTESTGDWIWKTIQVVPKKQITAPINLTYSAQKKVYLLQASTGKYGWDFFSASPANEADNTLGLVKEYSLTDAGWGWHERLGNSPAQVKTSFPVITPLKKAVMKVQDNTASIQVQTGNNSRIINLKKLLPFHK